MTAVGGQNTPSGGPGVQTWRLNGRLLTGFLETQPHVTGCGFIIAQQMADRASYTFQKNPGSSSKRTERKNSRAIDFMQLFHEFGLQQHCYNKPEKIKRKIDIISD